MRWNAQGLPSELFRAPPLLPAKWGEGVRSRDDATEEARDVGRDLGCDTGRAGGLEAGLESGRERSADGERDAAGLDLSAEAALDAFCNFVPSDFRSSSNFFTWLCKRSVLCLAVRNSFAA